MFKKHRYSHKSLFFQTNITKSSSELSKTIVEFLSFDNTAPASIRSICPVFEPKR